LEPNRVRAMRSDCTTSAAKHTWVEYRKRILSIVEAVASPNRERDDNCEAFSFVRNKDPISALERAWPD
jgi:hypothetical protein